MNFSAVAWWAYVLTALVALAFGALQCVLMKCAVGGEKPRAGLIVLKFVLWIVALIVMAVVSLPLTLVFVAVATMALLGGMVFIYRGNQKEAR